MIQIFSIPAKGDTGTSVVLNKGTPAPFDGILIDKVKSDNIKNELIDKDTCYQERISLNRELTLFETNSGLKDSQLDLALKQNTNLLTEYNRTVSNDNTMKIVYFGLGLITTGIAIYGASKITK